MSGFSEIGRALSRGRYAVQEVTLRMVGDKGGTYGKPLRLTRASVTGFVKFLYALEPQYLQ